MKYKILVHTPHLSTPGGKQNYYTALQDKFQNNVDYFFYGSHGKKEHFIQTIIRLISQYWIFYRQLKKNDYDLVHLNPSLNPKSYYRDSIFTWISVKTAKKTIVFWRGWNWEFESKKVQKTLPYFHATFGKANAMIVLAEEFKNQLVNYGYHEPIHIETTVVDDRMIAQSDSDIEIPRSSEIKLLFLSRIENEKGIFETLESFAKLKSKFPELRLDIGGVGGALEKAKEYAEQNNLKNIHFHGWVTGEQKKRLLTNCSLFVFPTYHGEGMPNCVLEAMVSRKPIITTAIGGVKDFFLDGQMGYLVNTKDSDHLQLRLEELLTNRDLMKEMGHFNQQFGQTKFEAQTVCNRLERIYSAVITEQNTSHRWYQKSGSAEISNITQNTN